MNFLNTFEDHVAGIFGAARAPFSFKKLAKQAAHEMEDQTLVINGVNTAPALYTILISATDDPLMAPYYPELSREVSGFVKAQATKKGYSFVGSPLVRFMIDPSLKAGKFSVFAENVDAPTLGRLYEEERAYQSGLSKSFSAPAEPRSQALSEPSRRRAQQPSAGKRMSIPQVDVPAEGAADPLESLPEPIVPVPKTVSRDQLAQLASPVASAAPVAGAVVSAAVGTAGTRKDEPQAAQKGSAAQLVDVVTGDIFEIPSSRCIIGREQAASDIILHDPNVSRRHAQLTYTGQDWSIEDLNSTNGTMVNNRRVTRCPLRSGDLLTFGLSTFEFRS